MSKFFGGRSDSESSSESESSSDEDIQVYDKALTQLHEEELTVLILFLFKWEMTGPEEDHRTSDRRRSLSIL